MKTTSDQQAIRAGVRSLMTRQMSAIDNFMSYVREQTGCTQEQASNVYALYRKERIIDLDSYNGTWRIKHGAFLDVDVLRRAATTTPKGE